MPWTFEVNDEAAEYVDQIRTMLLTFDITEADYAAARAAFVAKKADAWKKVDEVKKELGEKWDEVTGKR